MATTIPDVFTPGEASEYAKEMGYPLSDRALRKYCEQERLPARRVGRTWAIGKHDLDVFLPLPRPRGNPNFRRN